MRCTFCERKFSKYTTSSKGRYNFSLATREQALSGLREISGFIASHAASNLGQFGCGQRMSSAVREEERTKRATRTRFISFPDYKPAHDNYNFCQSKRAAAAATTTTTFVSEKVVKSRSIEKQLNATVSSRCIFVSFVVAKDILLPRGYLCLLRNVLACRGNKLRRRQSNFCNNSSERVRL